MPESILNLAGAAETEALGGALATALSVVHAEGCCIWLCGDLGAGKTTLARGLLHALGHTGRVPSPTYTLVEPYELSSWQIHHVDLYRLQSAAEAVHLDLAELTGPGRLLLIEWPERGGEAVPPADLIVSLALADGGRKARLQPVSVIGTRLLYAAGPAAGAPRGQTPL